MGEVLGRYELLKKLAVGGMGEVFLARQKGPVGFQKLLVVKTLLPHLAEDQAFANMFFDEARIAALLNHPNIAQIYDLGDAEGRFYIAMEYVHGENLRQTIAQAIEDRGDMPLALKCRAIAEAAAALDYAHAAKNPAGQPLGLIHRDVSPQNIMLGFAGEVKLVDFGVAKAHGKLARTATGIIKGKYAYMSPEQAMGQELDGRSDLFGLGIVFHEILCLERLFKRDNDTDTLKAVVRDAIPVPSQVMKGIPKAIDAIVMKALERRQENRFQSGAELQGELDAFLRKQRLPATAAHLSAFMKDLFPAEANRDLVAEVTSSDAGPPPVGPVTAPAPVRPPPDRHPAPPKKAEAAPSARAPEAAPSLRQTLPLTGSLPQLSVAALPPRPSRPAAGASLAPQRVELGERTEPSSPALPRTELGAGRPVVSAPLQAPPRPSSISNARVSGAQAAPTSSVQPTQLAAPELLRAAQSGGASLDPLELSARIRGCGAGDGMRGMFFNAAIATVLRYCGAAAEPKVRGAATEPKMYVDALVYPTPEFLRVLWKGVELLAPRCGGVDKTFHLLGMATFSALLASPLGAPLGQLGEGAPQTLVKPLLQLLSPMIQPGQRLCAQAGPGFAEVVLKGEVLPVQVYGGLLTGAFEKMRATTPTVSWEKTTPERIEVQVRW